MLFKVYKKIIDSVIQLSDSKQTNLFMAYEEIINSVFRIESQCIPCDVMVRLIDFFIRHPCCA